jgi:type IV pilus biogenesis protein CpaD/CtpE
MIGIKNSDVKRERAVVNVEVLVVVAVAVKEAAVGCVSRQPCGIDNILQYYYKRDGNKPELFLKFLCL